MKKIFFVIIVAVIVMSAVLFVPVPSGTYDDGKTKEYKALTYKMIKWNRFYEDDMCYNTTRFYFGKDKNKSIDELWKEINPDSSEIEFSSALYSVNYSSVSNFAEGCLNSKTLYSDSVKHLPIFKIENKTELDNFKENFDDVLSFDFDGGEVPSFEDSTASYDDAFFNENTLMLCYLDSSSGSYRFGVKEVYCDGEAFCVYVEQTNNPEVFTCDMSGWLVTVNVKKSDIADCTSFDAQLETVSN